MPHNLDACRTGKYSPASPMESEGAQGCHKCESYEPAKCTKSVIKYEYLYKLRIKSVRSHDINMSYKQRCHESILQSVTSYKLRKDFSQ